MWESSSENLSQVRVFRKILNILSLREYLLLIQNSDKSSVIVDFSHILDILSDNRIKYVNISLIIFVNNKSMLTIQLDNTIL